ncbi:hypothetical protein CC78DRAFT_616241 [Lojkania enalia]|uniref:Uncharacterized protein n=1 Tax=Lojkania enalia TaxID=147567 RepID=A0A9P4K9J6_9PLEO|nr:hypothetical protein CC78DRAFT_616241 [Didymosphaeria enalia]
MKTFVTVVVLANSFSAVLGNPVIVPRTDVSPKYACTNHSDCGVVTAYNCCGMIEVCARTDAVFTRKEGCPNGGMSVCGWRVPEGCGCNIELGACATNVL